MSPATQPATPAQIPYFLGKTIRRVTQNTQQGPRVIEIPTNALQGKVVSLAPKMKQNQRGSNYFVVRVAVGELGFCMATAYDRLAQEFAGLTVGDIITADGTWRRETRFDPQVGADVVTNWFTARNWNLIQNAPAPEDDHPPFADPDEYDESAYL